jgi:hypothetical protein
MRLLPLLLLLLAGAAARASDDPFLSGGKRSLPRARSIYPRKLLKC